MMVRNARQVSFCEAVKRTFDGAHPCDMCKRISKASSTEKKQNNPRGEAKTDLICVVRQVALLPPFVPVDYSQPVSSLITGSRQPPSPPPEAI
jgi:hypothetical protein